MRFQKPQRDYLDIDKKGPDFLEWLDGGETMMKSLLFDLDGTLLPMDTDTFVYEYLKALAPTLRHKLEPTEFVHYLLGATKDMIENEEASRTNEEVFIESFCRRTGLVKEEIWPMLDRFYEQEFPNLAAHTKPTKLARKVVQAALERGFMVAIATNPVFPKAAVIERMRWAGLTGLPFSLVTVYEETHYCKPNPKYYIEVAEKLGVAPQECVMIGNDMQEDMVASTVGMKTYLLHEWRIDRGQPQYRIDQEGTMEELLTQIKEGKGIF